MKYDEQQILTQYVWQHCFEQMTHLEKLGWRAIAAREKAAATNDEKIKQHLLQKFGAENDPKVVAALANGHEAFRIAIKDRILRDCPDVVNRCPKCKRVARTPQAKQCRWCYYDWHQPFG